MKKGSPSPYPSLPKTFVGGLCKDKGGLRGTPASTSILFCQFVVPCSFASRDKASIAAHPNAYTGRSSGRPPPVRSASQAAGVEKLSGLRGGRGLPARAAQVIHAGREHPPAWEMAACAGRAGGLPLEGLVEPGRNGDGEQRPRGHCLVPAGRPLASSSCGEDETVSPEQSEPHRVSISYCVTSVPQLTASGRYVQTGFSAITTPAA